MHPIALLDKCKAVWTRALLKGIHYGDRHRQLDLLYRMPDPWGLDCDRERFRFETTNAIIRREFGRVGSLLEIGCGEGLQSVYLSQVCEKLYGIDVSSVAVTRARARCPDATLSVGDIMRSSAPKTVEDVDLVVACEVLYYVRDVRSFLECMSRTGKACLVTYYAAHRDCLEPQFARQSGRRLEILRYEDTEWLAAWWMNEPHAR